MFILFVSALVLLKHIIPEKVEREVSVRILSEIKLEKPKEANILNEILPPPPPAMRNTIKFTPPVIKPDEQVGEEEQPLLQKEVVEAKEANSNVTYDKGTDDVTAPVPVANEITEIFKGA